MHCKEAGKELVKFHTKKHSSLNEHDMDLDAGKPVFVGSEQVILKSDCSAIEAS